VANRWQRAGQHDSGLFSALADSQIAIPALLEHVIQICTHGRRGHESCILFSGNAGVAINVAAFPEFKFELTLARVIPYGGYGG
jgi:hypothetical protein